MECGKVATLRRKPFSEKVINIRRLHHRQLVICAVNIALFSETLVMLAAASFKVRFVPFSRITASLARRNLQPSSCPIDLGRLSWAVHGIASRMPFRCKCIERALCLQGMLRRRGCSSTLHYGVRRSDDGDIAAHVWLSVGDDILIGGEAAPDFVRIASFPVMAGA